MKVQNKILYPIVGTAMLAATLGLSAVCPQACFADDLDVDNVPPVQEESICEASDLESAIESLFLAKAKAYCDVSKDCRYYDDLCQSYCDTLTELQITINIENENYAQTHSEESKNAALEAANKKASLSQEVYKVSRISICLSNKQNVLERQFRLLYCAVLGIDEQVLIDGQNPALNDYSFNDVKQWYYRLYHDLNWGSDSLLETFMSVKDEFSVIPSSDRDYSKFIEDFKMLRSDLNSMILVTNGEIEQAMRDIHYNDKELMALEQQGEIARLDAMYTTDELMKNRKFSLWKQNYQQPSIDLRKSIQKKSDQIEDLSADLENLKAEFSEIDKQINIIEQQYNGLID